MERSLNGGELLTGGEFEWRGVRVEGSLNREELLTGEFE